MLARSKAGAVRHICLPGELTDKVNPPELRERYTDGLLDPVRLSRVALDQSRQELGSYGYASQILQDPVPLGGGMFKVDKLNLFDECTRRLTDIVRSWDKAGTKDAGAYSVGALLGKDTANQTWILDVKRDQLAAADREQLIAKTADEDEAFVASLTTATHAPRFTTLLEVEGGSGGKESGENTVANLAGHRVVTQHPTGDKESRAYPFASQVGGGTVNVLKRHWTRDYVEELRFFPHSKYKDQVDASGQGFNWLSKKRLVVGGLR